MEAGQRVKPKGTGLFPDLFVRKYIQDIFYTARWNNVTRNSIRSCILRRLEWLQKVV